MPRPVADLFLMSFTDGSGAFMLTLNVSDVLFIPASGSVDDAVRDLTAVPYVAQQLDAVGANAVRDFLREYGAWDATELADDAENRHRAVWLAACGLRDELSTADMLGVMAETYED